MSPIMMLLSPQLFRFCMEHHIALSVRHIPGRLNAIADSLSRAGQVISTEWTLHQRVVLQVLATWDQDPALTVDLFATRYTARLTRFVSPIPDPRALAVDAMSIEWNDMSIYAYPPTALIPRILSKVLSERIDMVTLIAPLYRKAPWLSLLLELCIDNPKQLPDRDDLLRQPRSGQLMLNPRENLDLHAWRISGKPMRSAGYRKKLPHLPLSLVENHLISSTTRSGVTSKLGVTAGKLISSDPLADECATSSFT